MRRLARRPTARHVALVIAAMALAVGSIGAPHAAQPAELGRLFLTPQQRIELDKRRQANAVEAETVIESTVTLNGQVTRSSGKSTVWLNGVPQYDSAGTGRGTYRDAETDAALKTGQTLDRVRGDVRDVVAPGAVRVKPGTSSGNP